MGRGDGSYARILDRLQRFELLAIDDGRLAPLRDSERRDLAEVIEDRCDRVLNNAHRITLKGPSMRNTKGEPKSSAGKAA